MSTKKKVIRYQEKKMSVTAPASHLYDKDFSKWARDQAKLLKRKEFTKLDMENLIEEIEDLSKREKQRLTSYLELLLMHKLKVQFQPEKHTGSWDRSIKIHGHKAQKTLSENPSLKSKLKGIVEEAYFSARLEAVNETGLEENTFPEKCPWSMKDIFPDLENKYC